jgi:hypothetical protein
MFSETLIQIQTSQCYSPEDGSIHNYCFENLNNFITYCICHEPAMYYAVLSEKVLKCDPFPHH